MCPEYGSFDLEPEEAVVRQDHYNCWAENMNVELEGEVAVVAYGKDEEDNEQGVDNAHPAGLVFDGGDQECIADLDGIKRVQYAFVYLI